MEAVKHICVNIDQICRARQILRHNIFAEYAHMKDKKQSKSEVYEEYDATDQRRDARQILREETDAKNVEIGRRLEAAVEMIGSNGVAAEAGGVSVSTLQRYIRGEVSAPFVALAGIARRSGVSLDWLATGEGPRERRPGGEAKGEPIASGRWPAPPCHNQEEDEGAGAVDVAVFFSIVEAAQALEGDLSKEDRVEIGMRMMRAIAVASDHDDHEQQLDQEDFHALARVVRKLVGVSQT